MALPADLDPDRLRALLLTRRLGRSLVVHEETGSTNDDAQRAAEEGAPDGHLVLADRQRAGRGARGRVWRSPAGADLYLSLVLRLGKAAEGALPLLTLAVGLGVARAVARLTERRSQIKWPNDVLLGGKKCAGILIEARWAGTGPVVPIVGIGLNVNRRSWPPELEASATSCAQEVGHELDRGEALAALLLEVEGALDRLLVAGPGALLGEIRERLAYVGRQVRVDEVSGELLGLSPTGALRIRTQDGLRELVSGTLRLAEADSGTA